MALAPLIFGKKVDRKRITSMITGSPALEAEELEDYEAAKGEPARAREGPYEEAEEEEYEELRTQRNVRAAAPRVGADRRRRRRIEV
ncbi:hypothetical protein [Streptomyces sp. NPDC051219]|uniref:hypothetical protein n=1 Tax=Streptomyces sp. NPDC051219 TaxID=3155283 RepID=UPI003427F297